MKTQLHVHSTHSLRDSVMTIENYVKAGKEMGFEALALTDHGVLTGIPSFYKTCKANGIKPICGVEAYVKEDNGTQRLHLILYAMDYIGYQAISKATKLASKRTEKTRTLVFPLMNAEILNQCFGPEAPGHGHVIATSACVGGVLAGLNFENEEAKEELKALESKLKDILATQDALNWNESRLKTIEEGIQKCNLLKDKKYKTRYAALKKLSENEAEVEFKKIQEEERETEQAKIIYTSLANEKKAIGKQITALKKRMPNRDSVLDNERKRCVFLKKYTKTDDELVRYMESEALRYQKLFGESFFYIEIQNHGIPEEIRFMYELDKIAQRTNIPIVGANDAHMIGNTEDDLLGRESVMALRFNKLKPLTKGEDELYLKTGEQLGAALRQILSKERVEVALNNADIIADRCNLVFEENPHHNPVFSKNEDAVALLRKKVAEGVKKKFPNGFPTEEYQKRLEYELSVIEKMRVADYHLIVADLVNFAEKLGYMPKERYEYLKIHIKEMTYEEIVEYVDADQSYIGMTVGPGRGSSAGSLVCYVLNITKLDPIKYNLLFERYLNPERVSMPDIDTDYANGYREVCIEYTYKRYGEETVCRIVTISTSAAKSAIKDIAQSIGKAKGCEEEYEALGEALAAEVPNVPKAHISDSDTVFESMAATDKRVEEIIRRAKLVEGAYHHWGMHAAAVIISDNDNVGEHVPLAWDDNNEQFKTQCNMTEAEEMGLLKMDFLGLKNLNIITQILRLIYERTGKRIYPEKDILEEKKVVKAICASGKTNGIFQLESAGMRNTAMKMGLDCFEDIILLVAAYRPGPMDSIPQMIKVKKGAKPEYRCPQLAPILDATYGAIMYQEQIQQIFRTLAGYSYGRADLVRRAMSKKKEKVFLAEKPAFIYGDEASGIKGCVNNGISEEVAGAIFEDMIDFAKYAFNKSHAAVYARITYILCWLKYYYPTEFMTVTMSWANKTKMISLIPEAREMGIEICPPDINCSEEAFSILNDKIFFGLTAIKGIGTVESILKARMQGKFTDFADYFLRADSKSNVTAALIEAGAFDKFCPNRKALGMAHDVMKELSGDMEKAKKGKSETEKYLNVLKNIKEHMEEIDGLDDGYIMQKLREVGYKNKTLPTIEKLNGSLAKFQARIDEGIRQIREVNIPSNIDENIEEKLRKEKALIGVYLSGHPLDAYEIPQDAVAIESISQKGRTKICGVITDMVIRKRRLDGAEMAFFNLEDKSDVIPVCCFVKEYGEYCNLLAEGAMIEVSGTIMEETKAVSNNSEEDGENSDDAAEETVFKVAAKTIKTLNRTAKEIILRLDNIMQWNDVYEYFVKKFVSPEGEYRLVLKDELFGELRQTPLRVKREFLQAELKYAIIA